MKHQDDQVMAVSLLALMREPERHISQVREVCEITGRLDTREIEIEFSSKASSSSLETHQSPAVIDIAHPKKGKLLNFEILSPPEQATRIDHASHIWVAQYLIYFRFMSLIRPITLNDHSDSDFSAPGVDSTLEHLLDALETLLKIPQENNVAKARLALDSVFKVEDGEPELLPELKIPFTADRIKGLYALCEMLTERYLVLIEVEQHENRPCLLRYRHSHAIEEYNQHPVRARIGGLSAAWNSAKNFFRAFFGVPPTHMRIHVPWAKRTSDYKLFCEAPREVFITHHRIRAHKRTPEGDSFDTLPGEGVLWSRNSSSGINAHCFIGNGYRERADHALHVTFQHVENLGGPSLRLVIASVTMMVVMWALYILPWAGIILPPGNAIQPALVLAILALVLAAADSFQQGSDRARFGSPIQIRILSFILSLATLTFAVSLVPASPIRWLGLVGSIVGSLIVAASVFRYARVLGAYRRVTEGGESTADNMS
ncbi:hypothetical protein [Raineyella sp. W15-4]|uniref:hypothetical protein n=1 Tax=Raineyella sp. W15-4 TaxID=3081651 RepID=UPI00295561F7|nr:hypothetical protein [Raineyella sp. W15-4]WOQ17592.1 hypothetical protein R0145_02450 [Raineyella sp. W15-4]